MNFNPPNTSILAINRTVVWLIVFGLILLLSVVLFSSRINEVLAAEPTPPSVAIVQPATTPQPNQLNDIQLFLNHPANFKVIPPGINPVEAFVDGKTTKFLVGF